MAHAYSMYFGGGQQFDPRDALRNFLDELQTGYLADPEKNRADLAALMRALSAVADPKLTADEIIDRWKVERIENGGTGIIDIIAKSFAAFENDFSLNYHKRPQLLALKAKYRAEAAGPQRRKRGRPSNAERAAAAAQVGARQ